MVNELVLVIGEYVVWYILVVVQKIYGDTFERVVL